MLNVNKLISHSYSLSSYVIKISTVFWFLLISLLVGCTTTQPINDIKSDHTSDIIERQKTLTALTSWKLKGKIAFINSEERKSASLYWNKLNTNQQLNLTTYLGINVLKLTSQNGLHVIEVDGKSYEGNNLDALIESLVNIRFPAQALSYWIKAIPYNNNDNVTFSPQTKLPLTLSSQYNGYQWLIKYASYQTITTNNEVITLPNKIKITSGDLTINIAINQWTL